MSGKALSLFPFHFMGKWIICCAQRAWVQIPLLSIISGQNCSHAPELLWYLSTFAGMSEPLNKVNNIKLKSDIYGLAAFHAHQHRGLTVAAFWPSSQKTLSKDDLILRCLEITTYSWHGSPSLCHWMDVAAPEYRSTWS